MSGGTGQPPRTRVQPLPPPEARLTGDPNHIGRHRAAGWEDTGTLTEAELAAARGAQRAMEPASGVSSYVVSHLRTLVPLLWGAGITWLVEHFASLPPAIASALQEPTVIAVVTSGVTFLWYALWRWLEPRVPAALAALVLGHPAEPRYPG